MATRKQIRQGIKTLIESNFTKTIPYRLTSVDQRDFPLAMIYLEAGDSEVDHDTGYESEGLLNIELWAVNADDIDSALDALSNSVNQLIDNNDTLSGLVNDITRTGYSYERDPESFSGSLTLTFLVHYDDED